MCQASGESDTISEFALPYVSLRNHGNAANEGQQLVCEESVPEHICCEQIDCTGQLRGMQPI
jgi:hypothetical protein